MSYQKTNWQDLPSTATPINATNLNKMENGIADANGAIGVDAYDDTATYVVNDLCIKDNTLYICTTAITTTEAWNVNHWKAITIADMLISKTEINNIVTELNKKIDVSNIEGTATPTTNGLMSLTDKEKINKLVFNGNGKASFENKLFSVFSGCYVNNTYSYGFTIRFGSSSLNTYVDDTYWISFGMSSGNILSGFGIQINGALNPTWHSFL